MQDSLFWNKVAGAILGAGLIAMVCGFAAELAVHPQKLQENAFAIAVPEGGKEAPGAAEAAFDPVGPLLAAASKDKGEKDAKKCLACHSFDKGGPNKVGPNLWNVLGGPRAHAQGFAYSSGLAGMKGQTWDYEAMSEFIANPKKFLPGTKMAFPGIKSTKERADVVLYLRSLSDSPKPLP